MYVPFNDGRMFNKFKSFFFNNVIVDLFFTRKYKHQFFSVEDNDRKLIDIIENNSINAVMKSQKTGKCQKIDEARVWYYASSVI